jgi:predicted porin
LTYQVDKDTDLHAFYTFLRTFRAMRALNDQSNTTSGGTFYSEATTYDVQTAGIGGNWRANDKLKFGADYIYSYGSQRFAQSGSWDTSEAGQTFPGDPLLSTASANHQVKIHATYDYSPDTSFYLGYQFASLDMTDWALVGASVGQVLTGDVPAKYDVSTIMAAVTLKI